ncbi:hypothetical protein IAT40_004263 [Kwoniella sp. CBS 6097]
MSDVTSNPTLDASEAGGQVRSSSTRKRSTRVDYTEPTLDVESEVEAHNTETDVGLAGTQLDEDELEIENPGHSGTQASGKQIRRRRKMMPAGDKQYVPRGSARLLQGPGAGRGGTIVQATMPGATDSSQARSEESGGIQETHSTGSTALATDPATVQVKSEDGYVEQSAMGSTYRRSGRNKLSMVSYNKDTSSEHDTDEDAKKTMVSSIEVQGRTSGDKTNDGMERWSSLEDPDLQRVDSATVVDAKTQSRRGRGGGRVRGQSRGRPRGSSSDRSSTALRRTTRSLRTLQAKTSEGEGSIQSNHPAGSLPSFQLTAPSQSPTHRDSQITESEQHPHIAQTFESPSQRDELLSIAGTMLGLKVVVIHDLNPPDQCARSDFMGPPGATDTAHGTSQHPTGHTEASGVDTESDVKKPDGSPEWHAATALLKINSGGDTET